MIKALALNSIPFNLADEAAKRKRPASFDESASTRCPGSSSTLDSLPSMSADELEDETTSCADLDEMAELAAWEEADQSGRLRDASVAVPQVCEQECFSAAEPAEIAARLRHKIAVAELTGYATLLEQLDPIICLPNASLAGQEARVEQAAAEPRRPVSDQLRSFLDVRTRPNARDEGAAVAGFEARLRGQMAAAELTAYATIWEEADAILRVHDDSERSF